MFGAWGNPDHEESIRIIHRALDAGINFVDTADVYAAGESEEIVGKALAGGRRDDVVLATKFHGVMGDDPNQRGNARRWIMQAVEGSLRRLGTDWIDLYQVHRPDPDTDIDETLGALSDLVHAGKVRYVGTSTFPAHEIVEAQWTAERRGRERFVCEQPLYSLLARGIEADVLPVCRHYGMGVISWSPLSGGWLSGLYRQGQRSSGEHPVGPAAAALRPDAAGKSTQARGGGAIRASGGRSRPEPDPAGAGVRDPPSRDHLGDHRPSHDGAAREPARGRERRPRRRSARSHRRDRPAWDDAQSGGRRLHAGGSEDAVSAPPVIGPAAEPGDRSETARCTR